MIKFGLDDYPRRVGRGQSADKSFGYRRRNNPIVRPGKMDLRQLGDRRRGIGGIGGSRQRFDACQSSPFGQIQICRDCDQPGDIATALGEQSR
jgi:hypothetical protein